MYRSLRIRWELEPELDFNQTKEIPKDTNHRLANLAGIQDLITGASLTSHYQPIYSAKSGAIFGFEALARLSPGAPFKDIENMFHTAKEAGCLVVLDAHCMVTALRCLDKMRFLSSGAYLFINSCPETLMDLDVSFSIVNDNLQSYALPAERIVLEVTEESVISNYELFRNSLQYLRCRGFKIAIDDFGSGYAGLKMLSTIEPDFLKIDRHFISTIDKAKIKFNLVDAIVTACNRIGIDIVAEGIERPEELAIVNEMGIDYLQGFLLGRPSTELDYSPVVLPGPSMAPAVHTKWTSNRCFIGDIVSYVDPINLSDTIESALKRFWDSVELQVIPVVDNKKVSGILNRHRFMERQIMGSTANGNAAPASKKIEDIMEREFMHFEINCTLQEASKRISTRSGSVSNNDIVVLKHGYYYGIVEISLLLDALSEQNLLLAKDANPLSGLPGNNTIQREISRRLTQNMHFDVLYIDIDHFKPFNDHYGFVRGDLVITTLADIIRQALQKYDAPFNFAGHIGGDDFIIITRPAISQHVAQAIIDSFTGKLNEFHGNDDYTASGFTGVDRRGIKEYFGLLSLSIGIVSTEVSSIASYSQLASISCELKKAAKLHPGSFIARDRRLFG